MMAIEGSGSGRREVGAVTIVANFASRHIRSHSYDRTTTRSQIPCDKPISAS